MRSFVNYVPEHKWDDLIEIGMKNEFEKAKKEIRPAITKEMIDELYWLLPKVDRSQIRDKKLEILAKFSDSGITVSDRRKIKSAKLIAASALLNGRMVANHEDLLTLLYVAPHDEDEFKTAYGILVEELDTPLGKRKKLGDIRTNIEGTLGDKIRAKEVNALLASKSNFELERMVDTLKQVLESEDLKSSLDYYDPKIKSIARKMASELTFGIKIVERQSDRILLTGLKGQYEALKSTIDRKKIGSESDVEKLRETEGKLNSARIAPQIEKGLKSENVNVSAVAKELVEYIDEKKSEVSKLIENQIALAAEVRV
jgi:hypothetical protein